jgi:hypothetical protein
VVAGDAGVMPALSAHDALVAEPSNASGGPIRAANPAGGNRKQPDQHGTNAQPVIEHRTGPGLRTDLLAASLVAGREKNEAGSVEERNCTGSHLQRLFLLIVPSVFFFSPGHSTAFPRSAGRAARRATGLQRATVDPCKLTWAPRHTPPELFCLLL